MRFVSEVQWSRPFANHPLRLYVTRSDVFDEGQREMQDRMPSFANCPVDCNACTLLSSVSNWRENFPLQDN